MSEALIVWMSAGIILFIGGLNIVAVGYMWRLLKDIRELLRSNAYLNTEAIDLLRYGISHGYEHGVADALKRNGENVDNDK